MIHLNCNTCTIYEITELQETAALFVSRPIALCRMTSKYQHKTQYTRKRHLKKSATFLLQTPSLLFFNKSDVLIMKITLFYKEWLLKYIYTFVIEQFRTKTSRLSFVKKCQTGTNILAACRKRRRSYLYLGIHHWPSIYYNIIMKG